jgi:hypothetical protein
MPPSLVPLLAVVIAVPMYPLSKRSYSFSISSGYQKNYTSFFDLL